MNKFQKVAAGLLAGAMVLSSGVFVMAQGVGVEAEEDQPTFEATSWTPPKEEDSGGSGGGPQRPTYPGPGVPRHHDPVRPDPLG